MKCSWLVLLSILAYTGCALGQTVLPAPGKTVAVLHNSADSATAYYRLAKYYLNKDPDSSIQLGQVAIAAAKRANNPGLTVKSLVITGKAMLKKGKYYAGLQCYFEGIPICSKYNFTGLTAKIYNDLGIAYGGIDDNEQSVAYFKKALAVQQDQHDSDRTPQYQIICNLAETFKNQHLDDSTRVYSYRALNMAKLAMDTLAEAIIYFNIGDAWLALQDYKMALRYIDSSMALSTAINDFEGIAYCNNELGTVYLALGEFNKSIRFAMLALQQSARLGMHPKSTACKTLYLNYRALKNYEAALQYRNLEIAVNDSLNNVEVQKNMASLQLKYDTQKKQEEIELLTLKTNDYNNKRISAFYMAAFLAVLLICVSFAYLRISRLQLDTRVQNKEILNQKSRLEELNETKNKLFSIVSHDLKGPFVLVKNISPLIRSKKISGEESLAVLAKLDESFAKTFMLLDNLLYWANTQAEGIKAVPSVFNIWEVLNQNISFIETRALEKNVAFETNETTWPLNVNADRYMIEIAVRNLLDNAVKFTDIGGTITVLVAEQDGFVKVTISNTGQGIPLLQQKAIFNRVSFYSTYGTAGERGHGLGLQITKELVERNGGQIWFDSQPGQHCSFHFKLPAPWQSLKLN